MLASMGLGFTLLGKDEAPDLVIRVEDPEGNLEGDVSRTFLDLAAVEAEITSDRIELTVFVSGEFPDPRTLPGMGMSFAFYPECNADLIPSAEGPWLVVRLDVAGWRADWNPEASDAARLVQHPLLLGVEYRNRFTLTIPREAWGDVHCFTLLASTGDFPKWSPVTRNPAITLYW